MKLNKKFKQKWINALKSGKYKKGRYGLCLSKNDEQYCCLGVACAIAGNSIDNIKDYDYISMAHVKGTTYDKAALKLLVDNPNIMADLARANDSASTFEPAIEYINKWL